MVRTIASKRPKARKKVTLLVDGAVIIFALGMEVLLNTPFLNGHYKLCHHYL